MIKKQDVTDIVERTHYITQDLDIASSFNDIDSTMFDSSHNEMSFVTDKKSPTGKY